MDKIIEELTLGTAEDERIWEMMYRFFCVLDSLGDMDWKWDNTQKKILLSRRV